METTIAFVGAGSITEALLRGMITTGTTLPSAIRVTNRSNRERRLMLAQTFGIRACDTVEETVREAGIIFLCMKPKDVAQSLSEIARFASPDALYISVAAGCSLALMMAVIEQTRQIEESPTSRQPRIIRAMPNTSCAVLESATAYALGPACTEHDAARAEHLLRAVGACYRMHEEQLDAVTGLSGSGPAYVYYLVEALTQAGIAVGLREDVTISLVTQTLVGAAAMLRQTDVTPAVLRERVTSPGGTTMAGIGVLEERGFKEAVRLAVIAATRRATELGAAMTVPESRIG
ncbi:MAG: pyrroline-5-carboxylate reductase [Firmicutes bacterium]|nr:pyrroline-5-carboxylate reductase [Bacillota bacterium]